HEQPGDVVFYIPATMRVLGTGYPAPFLRLRDIALKESATASATLTGTEITDPAVLKSRFTDVRRVWVVTGASTYKFPTPYTAADKEKMALLAGAGLRILHRWQAGEVMLTLYGTCPLQPGAGSGAGRLRPRDAESARHQLLPDLLAAAVQPGHHRPDRR